MKAREYLNRAFRLDKRIERKLEVLESLNELAVKATSTLTGMPHNPSGSKSPMADTINRIIDLQNEINADIDSLVDTKREIMALIKKVSNVEYQLLLEQRYLCYHTWEQIAVDLGYSIHHVYKLHNAALDVCDGILDTK